MNSPRKVLVICPLCEKRGEILIPDEVIQENKGTSTVLVRAGVTCDHTYQVFLDKNCKVRGYQRTDYEVPVVPVPANPPQPSSGKPTASDPEIGASLLNFLPNVDQYVAANVCAKGLLELYGSIQSRRGFHPVLPDMKNWINQLSIGSTWDNKVKDLVKKRIHFWIEKCS